KDQVLARDLRVLGKDIFRDVNLGEKTLGEFVFVLVEFSLLVVELLLGLVVVGFQLGVCLLLVGRRRCGNRRRWRWGMRVNILQAFLGGGQLAGVERHAVAAGLDVVRRKLVRLLFRGVLFVGVFLLEVKRREQQPVAADHRVGLAIRAGAHEHVAALVVRAVGNDGLARGLAQGGRAEMRLAARMIGVRTQ